MTLNVEALVINYIEATTEQDKETVLKMVPLFMNNHYLRNTLEKLHTENNTLQFPAFNRRVADFKRSMAIAIETSSAPRGFIA